MKIVDKLINQIRLQTENENEAAISDVEILQYLNDGQERLHAVTLAKHPTVFYVEKEIDVVQGQAYYDLPDDVFLGNKVATIEYSSTGISEDYYPLEPISLKERSNYEGYPVNYVRTTGKILLDPIPQQTGKIRINYVRRITHLDKRRGQVDIATISGSALTSLVLKTSGNVIIDGDSLNDVDYICIVNKKGEFKMKNIPISGVDTGTGVVTIDAGFTFSEGESITANDFVVAGADTSTHSEFPRNCERYLIAYASWKLLKRDSSADFAEQQQELLAMEEDIVNSFADIDRDYQRIPVYSSFDYWE